MSSFRDEKSASSAVSDLAEMLSRGGFRLTKFTSNSKSVLSTVPPKERSTPDLNLDLHELPVERAFGVRWFVETNELAFEIRNLNLPKARRGIISSIGSLYDPFGFAAPVAPVTITARALIQDIWKAKLDWDQPLE